MTKMLLGETQEDLASSISEYFSSRQYVVEVQSNGLRILQCLQVNIYDVIILEIALVGIDGISVVRNFRMANGSTPVLLLSGQQSSIELQQGLDAGADAYLVRPFKLVDLSAQLRALLRRPEMQRKSVLISGDITVNTVSGTVTKNDKHIHLHPMELKLLQFLLRHPNQVFSADAIFERVWQKSGEQDGTVRTHIRTLRQKIDSPGKESIITTVRGFGYKAV